MRTGITPKAVLFLIIQKVIHSSYIETTFLHCHPTFGLLLTGKVRKAVKLFLDPFSLTEKWITFFLFQFLISSPIMN